MSDLGRDLLSLVPRLNRARGFRLYAADGRRLVDLWQYGGGAVLGHTAPGVLLALKDTASRGLTAPFPHASSRRLEKALLRLHPGCAEVRLYADAASADAALGRAALQGAALAGPMPQRYRDFADPALEDLPSGGFAALWRPWAPPSAALEPAVLAPIIPLPWPARPVAFMLDSRISGFFPPSDILSPVILSTAARAVDDLSIALPQRAQLRFKRTDRALAEGKMWIRRGIYLRYFRPLSEEEYALLFKCFLKAGFLLPPDPDLPVILPGELSAGEDATLAALLSRSASEIL